MKISTEKPACWDRLEEAFGVLWESGIVVTWNGVIHTRRGEESLTPDLIVHEQVHLEQQEGLDPEEFLERFISDKQYRYDLEMEAYTAQVEFLRATIKDPNELFCKIHRICKNLESNYGGIITYEEAKKIFL